MVAPGPSENVVDAATMTTPPPVWLTAVIPLPVAETGAAGSPIAEDLTTFEAIEAMMPPTLAETIGEASVGVVGVELCPSSEAMEPMIPPRLTDVEGESTSCVELSAGFVAEETTSEATLTLSENGDACADAVVDAGIEDGGAVLRTTDVCVELGTAFDVVTMVLEDVANAGAVTGATAYKGEGGS